MISCSCDFDHHEILSVGKMRLVTCRTPRVCDDCGRDILSGQEMSIQSFYDFEHSKPVTPYYICEDCRDLIDAIVSAGFCYSFGNVREAWMDFLNDNDPKNPAVKNYFKINEIGNRDESK